MGSASKIKPGDVFGRLTVLKRVGWEGRSPMPRWRVKCSCGNKFELFANVLGLDSEGKIRQERCKGCAARERDCGPKLIPSQLTEEDVAAVRERRMTGSMLAAKYGRSPKVVSRWLEEAGAELWWMGRGVGVLGVEESELVEACVAGKGEVLSQRLGIGSGIARFVIRGVEGDGRADVESSLTAWEMAKKGMTLTAIGAKMGVSKWRAMQLVAWWCGRRVGERVKRVRLERLSKGGK